MIDRSPRGTVITEQIASCKRRFHSSNLVPSGCFSLKASCPTSLSTVTEFEGPSKKEKRPFKRRYLGKPGWVPSTGRQCGQGTPASHPHVRGPVLCLTALGTIFPLACPLRGLANKPGSALGPMLTCLGIRNKAAWIAPFSMAVSTLHSHGNTGRQVSSPTLQRRRPRCWGFRRLSEVTPLELRYTPYHSPFSSM